MSLSGSTLGLSIVAFLSTNLDEVFLLTALFADQTLRRRAIVLGQFLGIGALVAASVVAAWLALRIPPGWIALLGLAPLGMGIARLVSPELPDEVPDAGHRAGAWNLSQVLGVTAITIANGGDNLAVYIPLFASAPAAVPLHVVVFALLTGVLCVFAHYLVHNPLVGEAVRRYGQVALPYVLIGLGLYILSGLRATLPG